MTRMTDEPFVDFSLMKEVVKAADAGVIHPNAPLDSEYEENHLSELGRRSRALDEVEDFVTIKTLVKYRKNLFVKILEYMNKTEGENHE